MSCVHAWNAGHSRRNPADHACARAVGVNEVEALSAYQRRYRARSANIEGG
jgi:hypothetical protein